MNPHNAFNHFEFTDINNEVLKKGGSAAAPRSKRNVPYVAPRDLPNGMFGSTSLHNGTATLDLPNSMFGALPRLSNTNMILLGIAAIAFWKLR